MESIIAAIVGAGITILFPVVISPLIHFLKQFIAFSSFKKKRIEIEKNSERLEKAISSLDNKNIHELKIVLNQLEYEFKLLDVQDRKDEFQDKLIHEFEEVKAGLEHKNTLYDKLSVSLPMVSFIMNYEAPLNFSGILKNFLPTKIAAENLKNEILKLENTDLKSITTSIMSRK